MPFVMEEVSWQLRKSTGDLLGEKQTTGDVYAKGPNFNWKRFTHKTKYKSKKLYPNRILLTF